MLAFKSLRSQLLFWLLAPLACAALLDAWVSYRSAQQTATIVQERMLLGAARVIGEQVHLEEGVVQVFIPPSALELFASPSRDRVFYRISTYEGQLLSGYYDLALPPRAVVAEEAIFFDALQREQPVHLVAFAQPVLAALERGPILIEVAQTLEGRKQLARDIWFAAIRLHAVFLVLGAFLVWFGLRRGMQPLIALRDRMLQRAPGALEPLQAASVPSELTPLVTALNDYVQRLDSHMSAHSRFIADASHQLRTPLTLLNTQVVYALRDADPVSRLQALEAIHTSVQNGMRLVHQLLAFTMAEAGGATRYPHGPVDLAATVQRVLEAQASSAAQRQIDLGFEHHGGPALVQAVPQMLYELVANLVDNALRYTQAGGIVTASVHGEPGPVQLRLQDNGPGIPAPERERVFERFYRLQQDHSDGCGLGLSIVREIARASGAHITLDAPAEGSGLVVTITFPADQRAEVTNSVV